MKTKDHLISFESFVNGISDMEKLKTVKKYVEKFNLTLDTPIEQLPFYKDYLSKFQFDWQLKVDEDFLDGLVTPDDIDFLQKLIFASFSSKYKLTLNEEWKKNPIGKPVVNLGVGVTSGENSLTRTIDELWPFQVLRLFDIYMDEQINIHLFAVDEDDDDEFKTMCKERLHQFSKAKNLILTASEFYTASDKTPKEG